MSDTSSPGAPTPDAASPHVSTVETAAPTAHAPGSRRAAGDGVRAGGWRRLFARALDTVLVYLLGSALAGLLWSLPSVPAGAQQAGGLLGSFLAALVQVAVAVVYEAALLSVFGRTFGKAACGLRVVTVRTGAAPGASAGCRRAAALYLPGLVPLVGAALTLLNVLWQCWDEPNRQCLHDKVAGSMVLRGTD